MPFSRRSFLIASAAGVAGAALPSGAAAAPQSSQRRFRFQYVLNFSALESSGLAEVWLPVPSSDEHQRIWNLHVGTNLAHETGQDGSGNRFVRFPRATARDSATLSFDVERNAWRAPWRSGAGVKMPAPDAQERARLLAPDRLIPVERFRGLAAQLAAAAPEGKNSPREQAERLFRYVLHHMAYDKSGQGWGRGDAVYACSVGRGNCTDFHSLYIALLRAVGIPAEFEIGFPIPQGRRGSVEGYHCWVRMYLDGEGWAGADVAAAWLHPRLANFYFGNLDPDRVRFSAGRDLRLPGCARPLNYFIYPHAQVGGDVYPLLKNRFSFVQL